MLFVAALWQLLNSGNSIFEANKLPICQSSQRQSFFSSISTSTVSDSLTVKKEKVELFLKVRGSKINTYFPKAFKPHADSYLRGITNLINAKIWQQPNISSALLSAAYISTEKTFHFLGLSLVGENGLVSVDQFKTSVKIDISDDFQATTSLFKDENNQFIVQEYTTEHLEDETKKIVDSIEIALLPIAFGFVPASHSKIFSLVVEDAMKEIDNGKLPYGITNDKIPLIKNRLLAMLNNGFEISVDESQVQLDRKCK